MTHVLDGDVDRGWHGGERDRICERLDGCCSIVDADISDEARCFADQVTDGFAF